MYTFTIAAIIIISAFAIGAYCHYTADRFAFNICLRDNIVVNAKRKIELVIKRNIQRMIKLEKLIKKAGKGSGKSWIFAGEWKELRQYNIQLKALHV